MQNPHRQLFFCFDSDRQGLNKRKTSWRGCEGGSDEKGNWGKASVPAMNLLVNAGIPVRTVNHFNVLHDKVIVTDDINLETTEVPPTVMP